MSKYSESVLNQIKNKLSIVDVVSSYMKLDRKNGRYWGLCPFHSEKTPSFTVVENNGGFFKCFGCGKGGSMFDFVMELEHVSFIESVQILAKRAGITLVEQTPEENEKAKKRKTISELYNKIQNSFHSLLLNNVNAKHARDYLNNRKITESTIEKFVLGFAPDDSTWLYNFLTKHGYSDKLLKESGLFSLHYDKLPLFRNRIMFPIRNWQGDCIAFGGRNLISDKNVKYINTPDTIIYNKKDNLFGIYESLEYIKKYEEIIICEGNFDVLSFHQAGLKNAVAPLGTALTQEQVNLIKRYCKKVTVIFDSDNAGQNALIKALLLLQKNNIDNHVVTFTNCKDASEVLQKYGEEELLKQVKNSNHGFNYLVHLALKRYDIREPKGITSVFKEVKPYLDNTSSELERQHYISYLSETLKVTEEQLLHEYLKDDNGIEKKDFNNKKNFTSIIYKPGVELNALLYLIRHHVQFNTFKKEIKINMLSDKNALTLYSTLENASRADVNDESLIINMIDDSELKQLVLTAITMNMYQDEDHVFLNNAINEIKLKNLESDRKRILSLISSFSNSLSDFSELRDLLSAKDDLDSEIEKIKKNNYI